jgi:light-regulated signal transduction histidine kinase (bacteriophytochrome)
MTDTILKNDEKAVFELRSLYENFGYRKYKMSKFEEYDLYARNKSFLPQSDGNIITFNDADGKRAAAQQELSKVFERFYRTDQSRSRESGGTGLGLSIAQWIAQRHGGCLEVLSKVGVGTRFSMVLPLEYGEK